MQPALTPPRPGKTRRVEEDPPPSSVSTVAQIDPAADPDVSAPASTASGDEETPPSPFVLQNLATCSRDGCRIDRTLTVGATAMTSSLPAHPLGNPGPCFPQSPSTITELPHDSVSAGVLGAGNYEQERRFLCRFREQLAKRTLPGMRQPFQQLLRTMGPSGPAVSLYQWLEQETSDAQHEARTCAFGSTSPNTVTDLVQRAAQGVLSSSELMARVATLQREQLHQALETVCRDGLYRGGTYAYAVGHRDALDDVAEEFRPLHGPLHAAEDQAGLVADLRQRSADSEQRNVALSLELSTLRTEAQQTTDRAKTAEAACRQTEELLKVTQDELAALRQSSESRATEAVRALQQVAILEKAVTETTERATQAELQTSALQQTVESQPSTDQPMSGLLREIEELQQQVNASQLRSQIDVPMVHAAVSAFVGIAYSRMDGPVRAMAQQLIEPVLRELQQVEAAQKSETSRPVAGNSTDAV